ncbi:MAG: pyridoxamine 5'-phosphate oxidase family protein [Proteobacteria bacterium]|nr:pyridoxamine 5'-phosphate oxidase family protein [Pseudomonadota bacterium]
MKIGYREARRLLRQCSSGALGSHSVAEPGYPYVTLLPYVLDGECRPLFLLSGLAEHTRNVLSDPRVSLLVADGGVGPLRQARMTLLGRLEMLELDEAERSRFLRYSPESADYLALGDFRFYRLDPLKARFIAGFGRMGWSDVEALPLALSGFEEQTLLARLARRVPVGVELLGVDCEGVDARVGGVFRRWALAPQPLSLEALETAVGQVLDGLSDYPSGLSDNLA